MEILEETLEPFVEDMKRLLDLGLEAEALEICKGVVLGCYRLWPYRAFRKASSWSSGRKRFTFVLAGFILAIAAFFSAIFA